MRSLFSNEVCLIRRMKKNETSLQIRKEFGKRSLWPTRREVSKEIYTDVTRESQQFPCLQTITRKRNGRGVLICKHSPRREDI